MYWIKTFNCRLKGNSYSLSSLHKNQSGRSNRCCLPHSLWIHNKVHVGETNRSIGERIKEHPAKIANNISAVAEHYQKIGQGPDFHDFKDICR